VDSPLDYSVIHVQPKLDVTTSSPAHIDPAGRAWRLNSEFSIFILSFVCCRAHGTKEAKINSKKGRKKEKGWDGGVPFLYLFIHFVIGILATLSALIGCIGYRRMTCRESQNALH